MNPSHDEDQKESYSKSKACSSISSNMPALKHSQSTFSLSSKAVQRRSKIIEASSKEVTSDELSAVFSRLMQLIDDSIGDHDEEQCDNISQSELKNLLICVKESLSMFSALQSRKSIGSTEIRNEDLISISDDTNDK